jgi:PKD repeat protein
MRKSRTLSIKAFKLLNAVGVILLFVVLTQCKKDPIKGWTYYIDSPPELQITKMTAVIKNCEPPYPVTFYQETANLIGNVTYLWDFGDGNTSTDKNPTHIYNTPGNYSIKLTVRNEIGFDEMTLAVPELAMSSIPVVAGFSYEHFNDNNFAPNKVIFSNNSSGANQFYWYFGDGIEDNDDEPTHVYNSQGTYTVKLRGTCTNGSFNETTQQIFINPAPKRVFIDSINLMMPSNYKGTPIYIELWHNTTAVGSTVVKSPPSFPIKFKRPQDFPNGYFFDYVQFTGNEVFKFIIFRYSSENPPEFLYEISLSSYFIQSNFYPRAYYQIEHIPLIPDLFIDLYMSY